MIESLRAALPGIRGRAFFHWAATPPMLAAAADAMAEVAREGCAPLDDHFDRWLARIERARAGIAAVIGAGADEIAFTTNTSSALSMAAASVRWTPGDRVLFPADEFPSNRYVWQNLEALGVEAEAVPVESGVEFAAQLQRRDLSRVRLIAMSAVSYRDGRVLDVAAAATVARAHGALMCVDAIQAVGAMPVDVRAWGADFVACGGQKWLLGPLGSGFLWIARERLPELHAPMVGWASSRHAGDPDAPSLEFTDGALRLEPGMPNMTAIAGLAASVDALAAIGWDAIHREIAAGRARLADRLRAHGLDVVFDGTPGRTAGIATVRADAATLATLREACERERVDATWRRADVRFAAHAANDDADFAALDRALQGALGAPRAAARSHAAVHDAPPVAAPHRSTTRAVVTGASRGLGAAIAEQLAADGADVLMVGRDAAALEQVAARMHGRGTPAPVDLADTAALDRWVLAHAEWLAECDVLVHAAALADAATFDATSAARERATFEVNAFSAMRLARAVLPGMRERRRGALLVVATTGARNALPMFSAYAASKAALWAWAEAIGRELAGSGVTVTTFVPPHMDTATRRQLGRRALAHYDAAGAHDATTPVDQVARDAVSAMRAGRGVVAPFGARVQHALNALAPDRIAREVAKRWRGGGAR